MFRKFQVVLAVLIFLTPFFAAFFISIAQPALERAMFFSGVLFGLLACITAVTVPCPRFLKITFFLAGAVTTVGWAHFLLFGGSLGVIAGFILVFAGVFLALGSTFWNPGTRR